METLEKPEINVLYAPTSKYTRIVDIMKPDGKGMYTGKTLAESLAQYPGAEIIPYSEAVAREERDRTTEPTEIQEDTYYEMLECLPPCKLGSPRPGTQLFHISERITHSLVTWCVMVGKKFYQFDATCTLTREQALQRVESHIAAVSTVTN